jgi:hypothetical protein
MVKKFNFGGLPNGHTKMNLVLEKCLSKIATPWHRKKSCDIEV